MADHKLSVALKETLAGVFRSMPEVRLVYLYGSRVEGAAGPLSDYDFGVLFDQRQSGSKIYAPVAHELSRALGTEKVDVAPLNRAPIELAYAIIAQGELVYEFNVATRVEFEAHVMGLYGDYLPVLRAQRRDILQGGAHATRVQRYRAALRRTGRTLVEITAAQREIQSRI